MDRRKDISLEKFLRYTKVLGSRARDAKTTLEIKDRWATLFAGRPPSLRSVQGDMEYLSIQRDRRAPLVRKVEGKVIEKGKWRKQQAKYYLARSQVATRFITEEAATELMLAQQAYNRVLDPTRPSNEVDLREAAERVLASSPIGTRLRENIRFLPDGGVGRLPASFDPKTRDEAMEALGQGRKLEFDFKVDHRNPKGKIEKLLISPLGILTKDGQVYVVGVRGFDDTPKPYALHRMKHAVCRPEPAGSRPEFRLDDYVAETHGFSHPEKAGAPPVRLELRVHKAAMYHFLERPLTAEQTETALDGGEEQYLVKALVPVTVQLVPFLVSMGPWVEVLGPAEVREKVRWWLTGMAGLYAGDDSAPGSDQPFPLAPR